MKNFLLFLCLFIFSQSFAQNNIQFNIHHKLGNNDFALNTPVVNNLGNDFSLSHLAYYIAEISIVHDGGQETNIPQTWMLVDASDVLTQQDLGNYNINQVEAIKFHVGVQESVNHLDPTTYPASHPLAPQVPSMHWGWQSGYRFAVLEGVSGPALNQVLELHALDDRNYFQTVVNVSAVADNGVINIDINGDYIRALEDLDVSAGMFFHGDYNETIQLLNNFKDFVFSAESSTSIAELYGINSLSVFPNPTINGTTHIEVVAAQAFTGQLVVFDAFGRQLFQLNNVESNTPTPFNMDNAGVYFITLMKGGQQLITQQFVVR